MSNAKCCLPSKKAALLEVQGHAGRTTSQYSLDNCGCLLFNVTKSSLPTECANIPVGQDNKLTELWQLYGVLSSLVKTDVKDAVYFALPAHLEDKAVALAPTAGPAPSVMTVKADIQAVVARNKLRRHKSVFLEEQELLLTSLQMTDDKEDLIRLLNELLVRMKEYLVEMGHKLRVDESTCAERVTVLTKQTALFATAHTNIKQSILPVKDSLAEDENQYKVVVASISTLTTELEAIHETKAELETSLPQDRTELAKKSKSYSAQMSSLELLRKKLEAVLEAWSDEQATVENGMYKYASFPYEHECNDTAAWAAELAHRETDDLAYVGGCAGCVSSCPHNTVSRSTRLAQCGNGGLKITHRCQRVANKLALHASVEIKAECDTTDNWAEGKSGTENLVRLGGRENRVATCPAGALLTGWGVRTCGNRAGLQLALQCAATGKQVTVTEVKGQCKPSVHAWGTGTHYPFNALSNMAEAACPAGSYLSGLGVRHCDSSKRQLRWVAQCATLAQ